ncbi:glycosyltransferase family A protein [Paenibacillus filicis]|uniref:Glycosyltransferase family A protein n=1 Tax=Paenibacillus gyeongsangnamensis TaxID=3388067 RepID=A0ABT4Q9S2_9BACL|nr:glycosyltransferase family A protein [Paenibacillus filicis]MCZ8513583.1 glycosyltransferase family A protein [Paenibacillus filicis]
MQKRQTVILFQKPSVTGKRVRIALKAESGKRGAASVPRKKRSAADRVRRKAAISRKVAVPLRRSEPKKGKRRQVRRVLFKRPRQRAKVRTSSVHFEQGFRMGKRDASRFSIAHEPNPAKALNRYWIDRVKRRNLASAPRHHYSKAAAGYVRGFFHAKGRPAPDWVLLPTDKSVAAVISTMNEQSTIGALLKELGRLPLDETYVIVNGSTDRSFEEARKIPSAVVLSYPDPLGHDVGRVVGAKLAQSDIVLFLDGDIPVEAEKLIPFIHGVDRGLDLSLNNISPFLKPFHKRDQVTYLKEFLNASLGRPDLAANSLTAVPHALSRKAIQVLGPQELSVPPKAQAKAVYSGLSIGSPGSIDVIRANKRRKSNQGHHNQVADLIIGDHVEAFKLAEELAGARLGFADELRKRGIAAGGDA